MKHITHGCSAVLATVVMAGSSVAQTVNLDVLLLPEFTVQHEFQLSFDHSATDLQQSILHLIATDARFAEGTTARQNARRLLLRSVDFGRTKTVEDGAVIDQLIIALASEDPGIQSDIVTMLQRVDEAHKPAVHDALRLQILVDDHPSDVRYQLSVAAEMRVAVSDLYHQQLLARFSDLQTQSPGLWQIINERPIPRRETETELSEVAGLHYEIGRVLIEGTASFDQMSNRLVNLATINAEATAIAMLHNRASTRSRLAEATQSQLDTYRNTLETVLGLCPESPRVRHEILESLPGFYVEGTMTDALLQVLVNYAGATDPTGAYLTMFYAFAERFRPNIADEVVPSGD